MQNQGRKRALQPFQPHMLQAEMAPWGCRVATIRQLPWKTLGQGAECFVQGGSCQCSSGYPAPQHINWWAVGLKWSNQNRENNNSIKDLSSAMWSIPGRNLIWNEGGKVAGWGWGRWQGTAHEQGWGDFNGFYILSRAGNILVFILLWQGIDLL